MQPRYYTAPDDAPLYIVRRDLSGGINNRQGENIIGENQSTALENIELIVSGERSLRTGATILASLATTAGTGLFGFQPDSGTNYLIANYGSGIKWSQGAAFSSIASLASTYDFSLRSNMVQALELDLGDVVIIQNGTNNALRLDPVVPAFQDCGNTYTSPPKSNVTTYYRDRLWVLNNNKLFYSGAIPQDYSATFNATANYYNIPVGTERALAGTRDYGLVVFGSQQIYQLNPTLVPAPATDKPELVLDIGCANGDTVKQVGDDFVYLSYDGVRAVKRTVQDKLQSGQSQPLSWVLADEFNEINWTYIAKADACYFNDRYVLTLPTGSSSTNNKIWVYYPSLNAWVVMTGLNIGRLAVMKFNNEMRCYGIDANNGNVYRLFYGTSDNGVAINYNEISRGEDFGQPMKYKQGGEFKISVKGNNATITPYADIDNTGFVALQGDPLTLPVGGLDFDFDFPFSFGIIEDSAVWHLDNLGKFKTINFKIYCNTLDAELKIRETLATTYLDEYGMEL